MTKIDLSKNTELTSLDLAGNNLTSINLDNNKALVSLWIDDNALTEIDLSQNTKLKYILIRKNFLTSLDVSNNPNINSIDTMDNALMALDLTNNINITSFKESVQNAYSDIYLKAGKYYLDMSKVFNENAVISELSTGTYNSSSRHIELPERLSKGDVVTYKYHTGYGDTTMDVTINIGDLIEVEEPPIKPDDVTTVAPIEPTTDTSIVATTESATEATTDIATMESTETTSEADTKESTEEVTEPSVEADTTLVTTSDNSDNLPKNNGAGCDLLPLWIVITVVVLMTIVTIIILITNKNKDKDEE